MRQRSFFSSCLLVALVLFIFLGLISLTMAWWGKGDSWRAKEGVGVVEVKGLITESRPTLEKLHRFKEEPNVKAIVLRVNSPGGAVGPSQEIMREVEKVKKQKKVVASLGTLAASGGYYVACSSDLIMASPGTATGSIGVILKLANVQELVKKLGVEVYSLKAGALKDLGNPFRPLTDKDRAILQHLLDNLHQQFIKDVSRNRKIPLEKMQELGDGRIFTGEEAKQLGLVDEMGNFEDAVQKAGKMAGIKGKIEAIYPEKKGFSLWRLAFGQDLEESLNCLTLPYPEPAYLPSWFR
ncbi:MAG: signal peptide peptidase SppA [Thermodesulfobacteriota bacterium]